MTIKGIDWAHQIATNPQNILFAGLGGYATIQNAIDAASAGDKVLIDNHAEWDENVTITKRLVIEGVGAPRSCRITSVGTNSTAFTINGANDVVLRNLNIAGRGTGKAVKLTGQIRRFTAEDCRLAGPSGGDGIEIAASSGGQVADVVFERCRIEGGDGVEFSTGEGGDPASQIYFKFCDFQYCTTWCINHPTGSWSTGFFLQDCNFLPEEDGTAPATGWIKADNAAQTGMISGCKIGAAAHTATIIAIDAGVLYVGNSTEAGVNTARPA